MMGFDTPSTALSSGNAVTFGCHSLTPLTHFEGTIAHTLRKPFGFRYLNAFMTVRWLMQVGVRITVSMSNLCKQPFLPLHRFVSLRHSEGGRRRAEGAAVMLYCCHHRRAHGSMTLLECRDTHNAPCPAGLPH